MLFEHRCGFCGKGTLGATLGTRKTAFQTLHYNEKCICALVWSAIWAAAEAVEAAVSNTAILRLAPPVRE
jgi:hypothetical protein